MGKRHLSKFDPLFERLTLHTIKIARTARLNDKPLVKVPCASLGQAMNLTMQLRQYWNALEDADRKGEIPAYDPRAAWLHEAGMLAARIADDRLTVDIVHRSQLKTSLAIAGALGAVGAVLAEAIQHAPDVPEAVVLPPMPAPAPKAHDLPHGKAGGTQEDTLEALYPGSVSGSSGDKP